MFCHLFNDVIGRFNEPILWLNVLLDSRQHYESLEPLVNLLVFLVPKLRSKKQKCLQRNVM